MARPSQLIEHVAGRIASAVLKEFRKVNEVTVKIEKLSPPIAGFSAEGVSVELVKRRPLFVFDFDGTIAAILAHNGDTVEEDDVIVKMVRDK